MYGYNTPYRYGTLTGYPSGASARIFDNISMTHAGIWELKLRRTAYTGPAVRVKRLADDVEQDIDFGVDGQVDMTAYTAFGSGSEPVITVYDQSGNDFHFTQSDTDLCPILRVSDYNGKPCFYFAGEGTRMRVSGFTDWNGLANMQMIQAVKHTPHTIDGFPFIGGSGTRQAYWQNSGSGVNNIYLGDGTFNRFTDWSDGGFLQRFVFDGGGASNALRMRVFINRQEKTAGITASIGTTLANETHLDWNGTPLAATTSHYAEYFAFYYLGQDLSAPQVSSIEGALEADYFTFTDANLICEGDSLTYGTGTTTPPSDPGTYPNQFKSLLEMDTGMTWNTTNVGEAASLLQVGITNNQRLEVISRRDDWRVHDIIVIWGGTNDIADATAGTQAGRVDPILEAAQDYCQKLADHGWSADEVFFPTCLSRQDTITNANFESDKDYFNANLPTYISGLATLVDLTGRPELSDPTDTDYFSGDNVHLNSAGYAVVAEECFAVIQPNLT